MGGIRGLSKIQFGRETTAGSAVAATSIWRGERGTVENLRVAEFVGEDVGYLSRLDRTMVPKCGVEVKPDATPATFEQLPIILATGVKNIRTGVADGGGGSGYIYQYDFPTTAVNDIFTMTMQYGDNTQAYRAWYCFCREFSITGEADGAVMMQPTWYGADEEKNAFTGGLTMPSVDEILFNKGLLYIDAVDAYIGTTVKSNALVSFGLNVNTGHIAKQTASGELEFSYVQQVGPEVVLEVTFEHIAAAVTERDYWLAETPRQIRLLFTGPALTTPGTGYSYKTLQIDLAGKWESFASIGDRDGNDIVAGTFRARYNADAALFAQMIVVNELATILA